MNVALDEGFRKYREEIASLRAQIETLTQDGKALCEELVKRTRERDEAFDEIAEHLREIASLRAKLGRVRTIALNDGRVHRDSDWNEIDEVLR